MNSASLMAISPLDGRYESKCTALREYFSEFGLIRARVTVEIRWLQFLSAFTTFKDIPSFSDAANQFLNQLIADFDIHAAMRVKEIERSTNHDVKSVEYYLKEKCVTNEEIKPYIEFIHFGATSEDINNLAYALLLKESIEKIVTSRLASLSQSLRNHAVKWSDIAILARTHGQPATPTTLGKEWANTQFRLERQIKSLKSTTYFGKFNGATGNYSALHVAYPEIDWPTISKQFVESLHLDFNPYTTQIEPHDTLAECFHTLIRANTILLDFARDTWGHIALNYFSQQARENEVGSSTMPHKINPIDFENAEGNLGIANALLEHFAVKLPISRWQRDLSDSTVLRNLGVAIGHSDIAYQALLVGIDKLSPNIEHINQELMEHWELLAEPIQMIMRKFNIPKPYEALKAFTRGKVVTKETLHLFIDSLPLPDEIKVELKNMAPNGYIGYAKSLAKSI